MTRAMHDNSAGAHAVQVSCYRCGARIWLHQALADLDGPAFQAYYCVPHFPWGEGQEHVLSVKMHFDGRWQDMTEATT